MDHVIGPTNQPISLPAVASNDIDVINAVRPSAVLEHNYSSDDPFSSNASTVSGQPLSTYIPRTSWSRDASRGSFIGHVYSDAIPEKSPRRLLYRQSAFNDREQTAEPKTSDGTPIRLRNGTYCDSMADDLSKPATLQKHKSGGFRTAIRRIFGRKSAQDKIGLPAPAEIRLTGSSVPRPPASATPQRSVLASTQEVLRSSALGSHSPFALRIPPSGGTKDKAKPPRPACSPPESPTRPRRATLPSIIFSAQEAKTVNRALTGLGLQDANHHATDGGNIGFAVTSGSNPRRRSRSADACRDTAKEHRMSPIQWRRWRRRSDEIRYWRNSTDAAPPALDTARFPETEATQVAAGSDRNIIEGFAKPTHGNAEENQEKVGEDRSFNFGLPVGDIQSQERIGLEERMITLEIKLMDFEYAISKLQAGSTSPIDRGSGPFPLAKNPRHEQSQDPPGQQHWTERIAAPYPDYSPATIYGSSLDNTPAIQQHAFKVPHDDRSVEPNQRPTSVATTLKPGPAGQRSSSVSLTVEHYSTLLTLIRHEQSARHQLEDQVAMLQQQIRHLKPPSLSSRTTGHRGLSPGLRQQRGRSSIYSNEETDTDDENFQDVYVTPVERGEYEREQLQIAEGVAF